MLQAIPAATEAIVNARITAGGYAIPSIPTDVKTAKKPPAGVNAPYTADWNPAAREPGNVSS
jgi:hypothetical protein